jgi:hypothetical protein
LDVHQKQKQATPWNRGLQLSPLSEETKQKLSRALSGSNNPNYGKKLSSSHIDALRLPKTEIAKIRMSAAKKSDINFINKLVARNKSKIGTNHTYEHKVKISESGIGGHWYGNVKHIDSPVYCEKFNSDFKMRTRAYWGNMCFECGELQTTRNLDVHHVHYDKKMCCNGSPHDVVPLCKSCHNATNHDRDYWENHFTDMLYKKDPLGKCFFTKEEMLLYNGGDLN